jgi:uncharacterized LabA/DUF88 family protein
MTRENARLAVLIDADNNTKPSDCEELLTEIARYGTASVKRAYGDWTTPNLKGWKEVLHRFAIQPIQQFSYTSKKNSTDSAMIIDAMDLLHAGGLDGFCLVSSDSDFTRLATRIREAGLVVYGFGEQKTPEAFVAACDKFTYVEILSDVREPAKVESAEEPPQLKPLVLTALDATAREDGWASLAALGGQLTRSHPAFDPRIYKEAKLSDLARKQDYLETKDVPDAGGHVHLYVRRKSVRQAKAP